MKQGQKAKLFNFCNAHGLMSPQKLRTGKVPRRQRTCCTTWIRCERWFRLVCSVHRAGIFQVTHTAAKVLDVISRLPGRAGEASDAVSAYTQVKLKTHQNYWDHQNQSAQLFRFVYQDPAVRNYERNSRSRGATRENCVRTSICRD